MNCPFCNKEMELGYIQCRDGVTWTPKKQLVAALSILGKAAFSIENGAADNSRTVYAYRCKDCKKIVIDYSEDSKPLK
ncbi:MAG: hypothetical protein IKM67_03860 [Clostridia bacterium]|nr:hypothetical protein [Clostridia bacterium]